MGHLTWVQTTFQSLQLPNYDKNSLLYFLHISMLIGYRDLVSDQDDFYLAFKPQIQHVYSRHCSPYFSYFTD